MEIARKAGIPLQALELYGSDKAKVDHRLLKKLAGRKSGMFCTFEETSGSSARTIGRIAERKSLNSPALATPGRKVPTMMRSDISETARLGRQAARDPFFPYFPPR